MSNADLIVRLDHMSKLLGVGSYDVPAIILEARDAITAQDKVNEALREALEKIAGGFINSDCLMSDPPDWHSALSQFEAIARAALALAEGTERT